MPGNTRIREDLRWEQSMAALSLAGIRPIANGSAAVAGSTEETYTIVGKHTNRVIVFHDSGEALDIRFDLNATAGATDFPVASGVYFVLEVETGDVVHVYNTSGVAITVYFLEIL